ncbi:ribosome biogenesis GTP-binding protein YihA/YsxC [Dehalobacterium formicoaceticum]|uniref:Probable GTP-binding protein EngB n=1 Tax=Dehalobacterium formicoaceticum TaxID=51515 RepID=A0ABT1Y3D9_9FIRM|nr:ribosome biogenesis GTP-binding protein YihA/YsxC [Dehalobacterium formicoaceticum]MCR6545011.1 ribosome biogenesis GTP-binding protein YihA/YsxC [Dehalobacterium formicoaceticum]
MLKIKKSEYVLSAVKPDQYPEANVPEIALAGRSNVGKSSLINTLINRRSLARTSSQPGKTQTINFYKINDAWYFVDLPGYGFARVSHDAREEWGRMINTYLEQRTVLKEIWQLVDLRHPPSEQDQQMMQWLNYKNYPCIVVATKADKISKNQRSKNVKVIKETLGVTEEEIVIFSAQTGEGKEKLLQRIEQLL